MNHMLGGKNMLLQKSQSLNYEPQKTPIISAISWAIHDVHTGDMLWSK